VTDGRTDSLDLACWLDCCCCCLAFSISFSWLEWVEVVEVERKKGGWLVVGEKGEFKSLPDFHFLDKFLAGCVSFVGSCEP